MLFTLRRKLWNFSSTYALLFSNGVHFKVKRKLFKKKCLFHNTTCPGRPTLFRQLLCFKRYHVLNYYHTFWLTFYTLKKCKASPCVSAKTDGPNVQSLIFKNKIDFFYKTMKSFLHENTINNFFWSVNSFFWSIIWFLQNMY